jgi:hypothetical protein
MSKNATSDPLRGDYKPSTILVREQEHPTGVQHRGTSEEETAVLRNNSSKQSEPSLIFLNG